MRNPRLLVLERRRAGRGAGGAASNSAAPAPRHPHTCSAPNLYVVTSDGIMHTLGQFRARTSRSPYRSCPLTPM
jgi:hypothetical protein